MKNLATLFGAFGVGVGLMYFLDPDRGKRRRAVTRDRARHLSNAARKEIEKQTADLRNRAQGAWYEAERLFEREEITDDRLAARARTVIGRLTSHPHAVKSFVDNGKVILSGPVLTDEIDPLLKGIARIRGVKEIDNRLEPHDSPEHVSALQGGGRSRDRIRNRRSEWSSGARMLAAATGAGFLLRAAKKRDAVNSVIASVGIGLLARSATNRSFDKMLARNPGSIMKLHSAILINAPAERVFEVLKYPQYFPYFTSHVRKVMPLGSREFLWTVDGPFGRQAQWRTRITEVLPNEAIGWENVDGTVDGQKGRVWLERLKGGLTRLHAEMTFPNIGGRVGNRLTEMFGVDPKSRLGDDLLRLKTYIEKGKLPHDAAISRKRRNDMKVREIMTKDPAFATLNMSLHDAAHLMAEFNCGLLPVLETFENRKPIGVLTDRDITIRTVAHQKDPLKMIAGEVMTDAVITVTPETSVEDCIGTMERNQIRRVLVVDEAGNLCGIVAQADIARNAPAFETAELVRDVSLKTAA